MASTGKNINNIFYEIKWKQKSKWNDNLFTIMLLSKVSLKKELSVAVEKRKVIWRKKFELELKITDYPLQQTGQIKWSSLFNYCKNIGFLPETWNLNIDYNITVTLQMIIRS